METMEFDNASEQIAGLVNECGGFFERSSVDGNSYRSQDAFCRFASFTIRVPKENYETVLGGLQELGNVLYVKTATLKTSPPAMWIPSPASPPAAQRRSAFYTCLRKRRRSKICWQ